MKLHANAALSLSQRRRLVSRVVDAQWTLAEAAEAAEVSVRCARRWVGRYLAEGEPGLLDRSSAPHRVANRTDERRVQAIVALRRLRFTGPEIAELLDRPLSTVSGILTRIGMGKLGRLEPAQRYERARPGELIHIDAGADGGDGLDGHRRVGEAPDEIAASRSPSASWATPRKCGVCRRLSSDVVRRRSCPDVKHDMWTRTARRAVCPARPLPRRFHGGPAALALLDAETTKPPPSYRGFLT